MKHYLTEGKEKQGYIIKKGKHRRLLVSLLIFIALTNKIINKVTAALVTIIISIVRLATTAYRRIPPCAGTGKHYCILWIVLDWSCRSCIVECIYNIYFILSGLMWAISISFDNTGLLVSLFPQSHKLNFNYCQKYFLLFACCFLFVCMVYQTFKPSKCTLINLTTENFTFTKT